MNVGIYIYDEAEVLDFSGPFEVFSTASRICPGENPFTVFLIGETGRLVTARAGYQVKPAYGFADHPAIDVLIVSGGMHCEEMKKPNVIRWISHQAKQAEIVASVCTGAFLLAAAELLKDRNVTTHWSDIESLQKLYPDLTVRDSVRWIDEGDVVTSGGISAGIDMSLHIVARLHGLDLARRTALQMEFHWTEPEQRQPIKG